MVDVQTPVRFEVFAVAQPDPLPYFPYVFPVLFLAMWLGTSFLLSRIGGWSRLAQSYPARDCYEAIRFAMRSGKVGRVGYGNALMLGVDHDWLHMAVLFPFAFGHRRLSIPWQDISVREKRFLFFKSAVLNFAREPKVTLRISRRLAQSLFGAAHDLNPRLFIPTLPE